VIGQCISSNWSQLISPTSKFEVNKHGTSGYSYNGMAASLSIYLKSAICDDAGKMRMVAREEPMIAFAATALEGDATNARYLYTAAELS
jgi:hypothetical protein